MYVSSFLQSKHGTTAENSGENVGAQLPRADKNGARGSTGVSSARRARGAAGASGASSRSSAGTSGADGGQFSRAGATGGSGSLGGGRAAEVTGIGTITLGRLDIVVGVQGPGELILGLAHTVSTVLSAGGVGSNTRDIVRDSETVDLVEEVAVVVRRDAVRNNATKRLDHAVTKVLVRSRRKFGAGFPEVVNGGAGLESSIGNTVRSTVDTGRSSLDNLSREGTVVREGAD